MWPFKKKEKVQEQKDTVIQIDPFKMHMVGSDVPEAAKQAAINPDLNATLIQRIKFSIAREEKRGRGDHPVVKNLKEELIWREKIAKAGIN